MLIPSEQAPTWLYSASADTESQTYTELNAPPLAGQETAIQHDVTAWPADAGNPPFTVGGVYQWRDGKVTYTAHIVTEQHAIVNGSYWHVSEMPDDAEQIGAFTVDTETVADVRRFVLEVLNSQRWS